VYLLRLDRWFWRRELTRLLGLIKRKQLTPHCALFRQTVIIAMSTLCRIAFRTLKNFSVTYARQRPITETNRLTSHQSSYTSSWPAKGRFGVLNLNPQFEFWIFTSVLLGSSPWFYSFSSATVHCDKERQKPIRYCDDSVSRSTRRSSAPLVTQKSPLLCVNRSTICMFFPAQERSCIVWTWP